MTRTERDDRLVRRILRVNHAGEHGAISIYRRQIAMSKRDTSLGSWLAETLSHEQRHREWFLSAMPPRDAKPCRALIVWDLGGALLGALTALLGRRGILICTAAVERTVHRHLVEQIAFLNSRDPELASIVARVKEDEDSHLDFAQSRVGRPSLLGRGIDGVVSVATEALIWLSTRGDSLRLRRDLLAAVERGI